MSTNRMSEGSKRRIRAFNTVENRLTKFKLDFFTRHSEIEVRRRERETKRIVENLKKTLAYKLVLTKHNITHAQDYKKALDGDYSRHALRYDIKQMVRYMEPDRVRERRAKALIDENRKRYDDILNRNKQTMDSLCPPQVKNWRYHYSGQDDDNDEEEDDDEKEETTRKPVPRTIQSIMRRQQEIALPSVRRSPTKPTLSLKRQGITRSFLLESGHGTMDSICLKPQNSKPDYELPPLQLQKKLVQV